MVVVTNAFISKSLTLFVIFTCLSSVSTTARRISDDERRRKANLIQQLLKKYQKKEGHIRLVGGKTQYEGNVEILHHNKWGAICDDEWSSEEATVVCRQLSFGEPIGITHSAKFGIATRKYWMDNLYCDGSESALSNCRFDGWGVSDCVPEEAAGVRCKNPNPGPSVEEMEELRKKEEKIRKKSIIRNVLGKDLSIRLQGGRTETEGRVEVQFGETWGSVCGDGWSLLEANVVCKVLGLGFAMSASQSNFFGGNSSTIVLSGTQCQGTEENLSDCLHDELGDVICPGDMSNFGGVICVREMADLIFDHYELMRTAHLEDRSLMALQCAMEENCVGSQAYVIQKEHSEWFAETRRLLKFTASVLNAGTADFRPAVPKHLWEWHMCHMHYHSMEVFATYDVMDHRGVRVAEGHKASFCLEDNTCKSGIQPKYACANYGDQANRPDIVLVDHSKNTTYIVDVTIPHDENLQKAERDKILKYMDLAHEIKDMWRTPATIVVPIVISTNGLIPKSLHANLCKVGVDGGLKYLMQKAVLLSACRTLRVSVNCSDIYKFSLDCQWVDISELTTGIYTLKVSVNPEMKVPEMTWENNAAICTLMYTETSAAVYDCKLQRP